jgi:hypothetical protein
MYIESNKINILVMNRRYSNVTLIPPFCLCGISFCDVPEETTQSSTSVGEGNKDK